MSGQGKSPIFDLSRSFTSSNLLFMEDEDFLPLSSTSPTRGGTVMVNATSTTNNEAKNPQGNPPLEQQSNESESKIEEVPRETIGQL